MCWSYCETNTSTTNHIYANLAVRLFFSSRWNQITKICCMSQIETLNETLKLHSDSFNVCSKTLSIIQTFPTGPWSGVRPVKVSIVNFPIKKIQNSLPCVSSSRRCWVSWELFEVAASRNRNVPGHQVGAQSQPLLILLAQIWTGGHLSIRSD